MTTVERDRLARLEDKIDGILEKIDNLDNKFVTRREYNAIKMVIGGIIAIGTMVATFLLIKK
jgi:hypothetical protein